MNIWHSALRDYLHMAGITVHSDPARYDRLQRDAEKWWAAGGSMRSFVAAIKAGADTSVLSWQEARRVCERRYRPPL